MFWRKKEATMPHRDVQAETVQAIIQGAALLPPKRFINAVYTAIADNPQITVADMDELANRLSRLAWHRGRK